MNADDPRHGTTAGHQAHLKAREPACPSCVAAKTRYEKVRELYGPRMVPAIGVRRRIRALMALGHSGADIGRQLGITYQAVHKLEHGTSPTVLAATDANVRRVYAAMSMTLPPGPHGSRTRNRALRLGYAPPLAWDDVDDPNDRPRGLPGRQLDPARIAAEELQFDSESALAAHAAWTRTPAAKRIHLPSEIRAGERVYQRRRKAASRKRVAA